MWCKPTFHAVRREQGGWCARQTGVQRGECEGVIRGGGYADTNKKECRCAQTHTHAKKGTTNQKSGITWRKRIGWEAQRVACEG